METHVSTDSEASARRKLNPEEVGGAAAGIGPDEICDLVMKGGITSGVVYPLAVCELAGRFRFKNIGGTSAGAIAAAASAAAERGRRIGRGTAFDGLASLPGWLGGNGNLLSLFHPEPATRPIFQALTAALERDGGGWRKAIAAARSAAWSFPVTAMAGALPGLLLLALVMTQSAGAGLTWVGGLAALLLTLAGAFLAPAVRLIRRVAWSIPANCYGLTTGCGPAKGPTPPLTNWFDELLNTLAGKEERIEGTDLPAPLTFGDLWSAAQPGAVLEDLRNDPVQRSINLEMVTSCLTHGRPYRFPLETKIFYFDPVAWRKLFPEHVVLWMERHERPNKDDSPTVTAEGVGRLVRLPDPEHLPVVVAARMSLSFPLLISAVPLHAVDFTRECNKKNSAERPAGAPLRAEICWFSDGGISSNFPIHFFDAPLPRWPTFGVDLSEFSPDEAPVDAADVDRVEPHAVWPLDEELPPEDPNGKPPARRSFNHQGWQQSWTRFDQGSDIERLLGFGEAILNTMQNWRDNTQMRLPGYRSRIIHVNAAPWEGGLNLNMQPDVIARLSDRGRRAGSALARRDADWWDEHRWIRYRSAMAVLESFLEQMPKGYRQGLSARALCDLIEVSRSSPTPSFAWKNAKQSAFAVEATLRLIEMRESWKDNGETFGNGAPRPLPELRISPRV